MSWKEIIKLIHKMEKQNIKNEKLLEEAKKEAKNFK